MYSEKSKEEFQKKLENIYPILSKEFARVELAKQLGISRQTLNVFLKGDLVRFDLLEKCYNLLGVDYHVGLVKNKS